MFIIPRSASAAMASFIIGMALPFMPSPAAADSLQVAEASKPAEHFQRNVSMGCESGECKGAVPLPNKGTVHIRNLSCLVAGGSGSEVISADLTVRKSASLALTQYIGDVRSSSIGTHTLTQAMDVEVREGRTAEISIAISSSGNPLASCSVTGTRARD